jgi:uncharacterized protein affecting Mg2+/Co2+ transport
MYRSTCNASLGDFRLFERNEIVDGEGELEKPVLRPGEQHNYSSGCLLSSPYANERTFYDQLHDYTKL